MDGLGQFDPYRVLGLAADASVGDIRAAYRGLARRYHPDHRQGVAEESFFELVTAAYKILIDPRKRELFDRHGVAAIHADFDEQRLNSDGAEVPSNPDDRLAGVLGGRRTAVPAAMSGSRNVCQQLCIDPALALCGGVVKVVSPVGGMLLRVTVPPGAQSGQRICLRGRGHAGPRGQRPGDLILELSVDAAVVREDAEDDDP